ncbi:hypothetical protein GGI04_004675, partial [Coemansia thaxteri]
HASAAVAAASKVTKAVIVAMDALIESVPYVAIQELALAATYTREALKSAAAAETSSKKILSEAYIMTEERFNRAYRVRAAAADYTANAFELDSLVNVASNKAIGAANAAYAETRAVHAGIAINDFAAAQEAVIRAAKAAKAAEDAAASAAAVNIPAPVPYSVIDA